MNRVEKALERRVFCTKTSKERVLELLKNHLFDLTETEVLFLLQRMDLSGRNKKEYSNEEEYFSYLIPVIEKFDSALSFISNYRHLSQKYSYLLWYNGLGASLLLQKKAIEYRTLFYAIHQHHFLKAEVVNILRSDVKYQAQLLEYQAFGRKINVKSLRVK